jgi:cell division protein FtsB
MAATKKAIDNANRLRYTRALERFHKSIIAYLSTTQELTKEGYTKKCESALKILQRVEEVALYKGDFQDLQKLIEKMIAYKDSDESIEDIKHEILYAANQLDKTKNGRRYKKEKYDSSKYEEWE